MITKTIMQIDHFKQTKSHNFNIKDKDFKKNTFEKIFNVFYKSRIKTKTKK